MAKILERRQVARRVAVAANDPGIAEVAGVRISGPLKATAPTYFGSRSSAAALFAPPAEFFPGSGLEKDSHSVVMMLGPHIR